MMKLEDLKDAVNGLLTELESYERSPNKSKSLRVRSKINDIRKSAAGIRAELIALDKKGY